MEHTQDWEAVWSPYKRAWCCLHEERGCAAKEGHADKAAMTKASTASHGRPAPWFVSTPAPSALSVAASHDCFADFKTWRQDWSAMKKAWCCRHTGKGCQAKAFITADIVPMLSGKQGQPANNNHSLGLGDNLHEHNHAAQALIAMPDVVPIEKKQEVALERPMPYNCSEGEEEAEARWSSFQKAWCCLRESRGCPPATTTTASGVATSTIVPRTRHKAALEGEAHHLARHWDALVSQEALNEIEGMEETLNSEEVEGGGTEAARAAAEVVAAPVERTLKSPSESEQSPLAGDVADCSVDSEDWGMSWSVAKKQFCCLQVGFGCTTF